MTKETKKRIERQPVSQSWWAEPPTTGKEGAVKYFNDYRKPENFIRMSPMLTIWTNLSAWWSERFSKK